MRYAGSFLCKIKKYVLKQCGKYKSSRGSETSEDFILEFNAGPSIQTNQEWNFDNFSQNTLTQGSIHLKDHLTFLNIFQSTK